MKKLLGIIVLSLLLSGNVYAENRPADLEIIEFNDPRTLGIRSGNEAHPVNREKAERYCQSKKKFAYQFDSTINYLSGNRAGKITKKHRYFCSRENLKTHPILGNAGWYQTYGLGVRFNSNASKRIFNTYRSSQKKEWDDQDNKTTESKMFSGNTKNVIKKQCLEFGFKEGTELFADCQLKLFMMQNQNSNNSQGSSENSTIIIQSDNSGNKRKIDPTVWDDLLKLGGISSGSSSSSSSGSTSTLKSTCYNTGEETGGMNKSCKYSCSGNIVTTTISSLEICPVKIQN